MHHSSFGLPGTLPEKPSNDAMKNFRRWLQACVSVSGRHFEHKMLYTDGYI